MSMLQTETPVVVFGLSANESLNRSIGEVAVEFDGERYGVRLRNGVCARVAPRNLAPVKAKDFALLQRRISYEVCCFATEFNDEETALFPVDRKLVAPMTRALRPCLTRIEIQAKSRLLRLYADDDIEPYAQLLPASSPIAHVVRFQVDTPNKKVRVDRPCAEEIKQEGVMVTIGDDVVFYSNTTPRYHLPISTMRAFATDSMCQLLVANIIDNGKFLMTEKPPESIFYSAEERLLIFEIVSGDPIRLVSLQWPIMAFKVARLTHATKNRLRVTGTMHAEPTRPLDGRRVFPPHAFALHDGKLDKVLHQQSNDDDVVCLANAGEVPGKDLAFDPLSFLHTQILLCSHFLEWIERRRNAGKVIVDVVELNAIMGDIYHLLARSSEPSAETAMIILNGCVPEVHVDFLLPSSIMTAVNVEQRLYRAWMANAESLLCAVQLTYAEKHPTVTMEIESGHILAVSAAERTLRVGNFAANPLEMQRQIFLRDATARVDGRMHDLMEAIASTSDIFLSSMSPKQIHTLKAEHTDLVDKLLDKVLDADEHMLNDDEKDKSLVPRRRKNVLDEPRSPAPTAEAIAAAERNGEELLAQEEREEREKIKAATKARAKKTRKRVNQKSTASRMQTKVHEASCGCDTTSGGDESLGDSAESSVPESLASNAGDANDDIAPSDAASAGSETASAGSLNVEEFVFVDSGKTKQMKNALHRAESACSELRAEQTKLLDRVRAIQSQADRARGRFDKELKEKDARIQMLEQQASTLRANEKTAIRKADAAQKDAAALQERIHQLEQRESDAAKEAATKDDAHKKALTALTLARADRKSKTTELESRLSATKAEMDGLHAKLKQQKAESDERLNTSREAIAAMRDRVSCMKQWTIDKLHTQIMWYIENAPHLTMDGALSIDALLRQGYAAKNMIDFYRMLDPEMDDDFAVVGELAQRKCLILEGRLLKRQI